MWPGTLRAVKIPPILPTLWTTPDFGRSAVSPERLAATVTAILLKHNVPGNAVHDQRLACGANNILKSFLAKRFDAKSHCATQWERMLGAAVLGGATLSAYAIVTCLRSASLDHLELFHIYYQPLLVMLAMLWLWTIDVRIFERRRIAYGVCFSPHDQQYLRSSHQLFQARKTSYNPTRDLKVLRHCSSSKAWCLPVG